MYYWYDFERCRGNNKDGSRCNNRPRVPQSGPRGLILYNTCWVHRQQETDVKEKLDKQRMPGLGYFKRKKK